MSWTGDKSNPVPNPVQEPIDRGEKRVGADRSIPARRDTDKVKNFTITLKDIDETMFKHLEDLQLTVVDEGNKIKMPIFYGAPEKWVAARRDGYLRDRQGKLQLPAMIFQRTSSDNDHDMEMFNRHLKYPIIQKYSSKNMYTQFAALTGQNTHVHEVYYVTGAEHLVLTYSFIVWTEYHEQMNTIIEVIKFNTKTYWGIEKGFRFRVRAEAFSHTIELSADDDRMIKTEFTLLTNGYILPESYTFLDRQYPTTEKLFTPKKILFGAEVVTTGFDLEKLDADRTAGKWASPNYPNIPLGTDPVGPPISWTDTMTTQLPQEAQSFVSSLRVSTSPTGQVSITTATPSFTTVPWQPVPPSSNSPGLEGYMAHDNAYIYIYTQGSWKRTPINQF